MSPRIGMLACSDCGAGPGEPCRPIFSAAPDHPRPPMLCAHCTQPIVPPPTGDEPGLVEIVDDAEMWDSVAARWLGFCGVMCMRNAARTAVVNRTTWWQRPDGYGG